MRLLHLPAVVALFAAYFAYVCYLPSDLWLSHGLMDWIDPYFINGLLEHWYHSLTTFGNPMSPPMFYPARGTLGYSHGLILFAPFYVAIRPFLDPFPAHTLTLYLVMLTGSVFLYQLFRRVGLGMAEGLILSAFFATSLNVVSGPSGVWSQRLSVFLIPPILLLAHVARGSVRPRARVIAAGTAGLLSALLLTQDFYTGAFAWLTAALALGAWMAIRPRLGSSPPAWVQFLDSIGRGLLEPAGPERAPHRAWLVLAGLSTVWAAIVAIHPIERTMVGPFRFSSRDPRSAAYIAMATAGWYVARRWRWDERARRAAVAIRLNGSALLIPPRESATITAFLFGAAIGAILFLLIYMGSFLEYRDYAARQVWLELVQPNIAGATSPRQLISALTRYDSRRAFVLVLVLGGVLWLPHFRAPRPVRIGVLVVIAWSLFVLLAPLRFGAFSPWKSTVGWVPGFSAIRDPLRIVYVYELLVSVLAAALLSHLPQRSMRRRALAALVLALILIEWNSARFEFLRPRSIFQQWVQTPIAVDPSCQSFFVKGASRDYMSRSGHMWSLYGVDALFIALRHGIPTLNGYSAYGPLSWDLGNPQDSTYEARVRRWIDLHHLDRVCALDIDARTMRLYR